MSSLNIRKDPCELDFLSLGALVHRLDPGVIPFRKARSLEIHVSGGEYNVAAEPGGLLRAEDRHRDGDGQLPDRRAGPVAGARDGRHAVLQVVRARRRARAEHRHGVQRPRLRRPRRRWSSTTGRTRPAPCSSRATSTGRGIFARGVRWFHSGGIFASLSETTAPLIIEGMQAAKAAGAITSFDLNYRAKLWASVGGAERGQQVIKKIAGQLDALFGNEEDLQKGLGITGPDVTSQVEARPRHVLRADRPGGRAASQHQAGRDDPARGALDQPARLGGRALARRPAVRQPDHASSTSSTASAAATASPPA